MFIIVENLKNKVLRILCTTITAWIIISFLLTFYFKFSFQQYQKKRAIAIIKPTKVFQIGFSKCGTSTLSHFFNQNGIPAVHHDNGMLPISIYYNHINGRPLISRLYDKFLVFTDMEILYKEPLINVGVEYFRELDKQYPNSKFILNTRDKAAWLKSRSKHPISPTKESLLSVSARLHNISTQKMEQIWSQEWDKHHHAVKKYFKNRPSDLIVFDIEKDSPDKLVDFFKDDFLLDPGMYIAKNQTKYREISTLWYKYFGGPRIIKSWRSETQATLK